jgi:hypothetical protein
MLAQLFKDSKSRDVAMDTRKLGFEGIGIQTWWFSFHTLRDLREFAKEVDGMVDGVKLKTERRELKPISNQVKCAFEKKQENVQELTGTVSGMKRDGVQLKPEEKMLQETRLKERPRIHYENVQTEDTRNILQRSRIVLLFPLSINKVNVRMH